MSQLQQVQQELGPCDQSVAVDKQWSNMCAVLAQAGLQPAQGCVCEEATGCGVTAKCKNGKCSRDTAKLLRAKRCLKGLSEPRDDDKCDEMAADVGARVAALTVLLEAVKTSLKGMNVAEMIDARSKAEGVEAAKVCPHQEPVLERAAVLLLELGRIGSEVWMRGKLAGNDDSGFFAEVEEPILNSKCPGSLPKPTDPAGCEAVHGSSPWPYDCSCTMGAECAAPWVCGEEGLCAPDASGSGIDSNAIAANGVLSGLAAQEQAVRDAIKKLDEELGDIASEAEEEYKDVMAAWTLRICHRYNDEDELMSTVEGLRIEIGRAS